MKNISKIRKRSGRIVNFNKTKITEAIYKAIFAVRGEDGKESKKLADKVVKIVISRFKDKVPGVEDIQDIVEQVLIHANLADVARAYILYREQRRQAREIVDESDKSVDMIDKYLTEADWEVKENANMTYSLQGLNNYIAGLASKKYWLNKIYPQEVREAIQAGSFHVHDLSCLGSYCMGWDLQGLLLRGFTGVFGKITSKPAKHLHSALGQVVNFFYTLQGEAAGAEAFSSFDTYLAPFIAYDKLNHKEVKQAVQEFLFNCNVPTRVGFQCVSEDTEILSPTGWKNYQEVRKGDIITTFNLKTKILENKRVSYVFKKKYQGVMYRLRNRIQDQLISPKHKVVRRKFNSEEYILDPIEEVIGLKSPSIIPVAGKNTKPDVKINDEQIKLMAWIISEGSIERALKFRSCYRVSIYQSKIKNRGNYKEIIRLLKYFKLKCSEYEVAALGDKVCRLRLNAESSRTIHQWFGTRDNIHFIPPILFNLSKRQSRLFLETYLKGDGFEECKISTTEMDILNGLQRICVSAEYGFTVLNRKPTIGQKDIYVLRIIKHKETYIQRIEKVNYKGVIWSVHTQNETIVARRQGKVFITGNTPFTNITLDLKVPKNMAKLSVIIGGKAQDRTYGEFQKEMDMLNKAFYEIIMEGDADQRVFTFPIPTINITKDFDWDNPAYKPMWEATAKYGINYFSNFINSELDPEDIRSMCCRLRLNNKELHHRGGGLFGSAPLTGSVGVVTINLPQIGYLSKTKKEFWERLERLMDLANESLEIKRKVLEDFMDKGLYPYSKFYLSEIKKLRKSYLANHFSTIGLIGLNEALLNFMGEDIVSEKGQKFALDILDFMRDRLLKYQKETGQIYNLEATPAEGTSYRLAEMDKKKYPDIITAGTSAPYYTNSSQLPVDYDGGLLEALKLQDEFQTKYTGGTVFHAFLGEKISDASVIKNLIKKVFTKFRLPYFTLTPTFSICPNHGYLSGEHFTCPRCGARSEVYSRIVGYLRPVQQWNKGKQEEYEERKNFKASL